MTTTEPIHHERIVVGVDASQHAARAADWAGDEAARRGVALHVVHALDSDPSSALIDSGADSSSALIDSGTGSGRVHTAGEAADQLLAETQHRILGAHPSLTVTTELAHRAAAGALVLASREAALLVVGTRGRGGFAGLPVGSVSARLAAHAHCPVVILRARGHHQTPLQEVVLGMQAHTAQEAILFAFTQAARAGAGVRAVHAWVPYPAHAQGYISDTDIIARNAAEQMVADLAPVREKFPDVHVTLSVQRGHPAAVLADASERAQLTVVGAHRHRHPLSLGLGPVIHGVLGQAQSPVAVVPVP
ncbi:MAG TPA: universal stress protein [Actinocrinis sp.]|nr:universal stress protein [Actinocrinis sp.]